jgi:hypothetical protein
MKISYDNYNRRLSITQYQRRQNQKNSGKQAYISKITAENQGMTGHSAQIPTHRGYLYFKE